MRNLLIGVLIGLVAGGLASFFLFVGVPRSGQTPGKVIQKPDGNVPAGTAQIVLRQDFFNEVLTTIFRDMNKPAFEMSGGEPSGDASVRPQYALFDGAPPCDGKIRIVPEGSGVQTAIRLDGDKIAAPLAFAGSYNSPIGCFPFTGWAQSNLELRYDADQKAVFGRINVETVNLDGVDPVWSGIVTTLVQSSLNNRVNPVRILDGKQIAVDTPIASTGSRLQAAIKDVRAEVKDSALNIYVSYDFSGLPMQ